MVAAALADGTADRRLRVRGLRPPAPARPPLRRRSPAPPASSRRCRTSASATTSSPALRDAGADRRAAAGLAGRLPVHRRHRRLRRGRALLPRLTGAHRAGAVRRGRPARDPRAVDPQPRQRDRLGRRPHGRRGRASGPCIEMGCPPHPRAGRGGRRPGRATWSGFATTSNLEAGRRYGVPTTGHQRARVHAAARRRDGGVPGAGRHARPRDDAARRHLRRRPGHPDGGRGRRARSSAAIRLDSGDLPTLATHARELLDSLGRDDDPDRRHQRPRRVRDRRRCMAAPVDGYGVGTSLVTGSGAPTAGLVYKLVERDGVPVAKKSEGQGLGRRPQVRRPAARRRRHRRGRGGQRAGRSTPRRRPRPRRPARRVGAACRRAEPAARPLAEARAAPRAGAAALPPEAWALSRGRAGVGHRRPDQPKVGA